MGEPTDNSADLVDVPATRPDAAADAGAGPRVEPAPEPMATAEPGPLAVPRVVAHLEGGKRQPASYWFFSIVAAVSAGLDLWSKAWASARLTGIDVATYAPKKVILLHGYLDFQYAQNPGGAWSMLRSLPEVARRPFFLMVSTVASVFIASVYARIDRRQWAMRWGLPLALGGAIGNLVDRIRNGWVVDFIHFWFKKKVGEYHWPTFNIADVWIVVGVALMAIDVFTSRKVRASLEEYEDAHATADQARPLDGPAPPTAG